MKTFVQVIFWLHLVLVILRIMNLVMGTWSKKVSLEAYAADTVLTAALVIWAGFAMWY